MHLPIGHTLQNSKYHILKVLGQGGFGVTYLAQHILLGQVVVKELFINNGCSRGQNGISVTSTMDKYSFNQFKERFLEEARLIVKFKDVEGIVKTFDFFEENNTAYFAMEYVNASSLADYIARKGALEETEALDYIRQVSDSLAVVHQHGVLHRDIKPHNILLTPEGKTVLIDFGIARNYIEGQTAFHTTFFTPRYAAPEQMTDSDKRGAYTDIYSLGATLYYCLTAKHPQTLGEISINGFLEAKNIAPTISDESNATITTAMKLRREERFQTIAEWKAALPFAKFLGNRKEDFSLQKPSVQHNTKQSIKGKEAPLTLTKTPEAVIPPPKNPTVQEGEATKRKKFFAVFILLAVLFAISLFQVDKKEKKESKIVSVTTESNKKVYNETDKQMEVEFEQSEEAKGLIAENMEAEFSKYDNSYACRIKGYLRLDKIEVAKLSLKISFLDESGKIVDAENTEVLSESNAMLRSGDLLPIKFLKYEEGKIDKPYKKAKISISFVRKIPASANYAPSKKIGVTYLAGESENMKVEVRERKSVISDGFKGRESYHTVELEFKNVGNSPLKMVKIALKYFDKKGKLIDQGSRYVVTNEEPLLQREQVRVIGTILSFKAKKSELGRYEIEIEEMR